MDGAEGGRTIRVDVSIYSDVRGMSFKCHGHQGKGKKRKKKKVEKSINLTTSRRKKEGGKTRVNKVNGIVTKHY